jgi:hypothetical protein
MAKKTMNIENQTIDSEVLEEATVEETVVDDTVEETVNSEPATISEAFETANVTSATSGSRGLTGTAQLTSTASAIVADVIKTINDNFADYKEDFMASKASHDSMDKLLNKLVDFEAIDYSFLSDLPEATTDGMLKSQQSKRSRAKSKVMTMDNYKSMMTGAVSERLLRLATGKVKSAGGMRRQAGSVEFSEEQLEMLKENQEQLRKELRNVQSKKSIMKSKAEFTTEDDRWQALLVAEAQLKNIRVSATGTTTIVEVDRTKDAVANILKDIDTNQLKAVDSKQMLADIKALLG